MSAALLVPQEAEVTALVWETETIFSLQLRLTDAAAQAAYRFAPGQFNMLYLYGVGEIPISIVSDPAEAQRIGHTIRVMGRVSRALSRLRPGQRIGLRGPFGRGWPLAAARGHDLMVVTGGLGCAPVVATINYVLRRRSRYGRLSIVQGVKHSADLIWRRRYEQWAQAADTQVLLAADQSGPGWPFHTGRITELLDQAQVDYARTMVMLCGPEAMMRSSAQILVSQGVPAQNIYLSMERNMQCALGHCGHCQFGEPFVCRDGPVFSYPQLQPLLGQKGV